MELPRRPVEGAPLNRRVGGLSDSFFPESTVPASSVLSVLARSAALVPDVSNGVFGSSIQFLRDGESVRACFMWSNFSLVCAPDYECKWGFLSSEGNERWFYQHNGERVGCWYNVESNNFVFEHLSLLFELKDGSFRQYNKKKSVPSKDGGSSFKARKGSSPSKKAFSPGSKTGACYTCGERGHWSPDCPYKRGKRPASSDSDDELSRPFGAMKLRREHRRNGK